MSYDGTLYKLLLVVHIAAVVTAFGTAFVHSLLLRTVRAGGPGASAAAGLSVTVTKRYSLPALLVAVIAGIALVVVSDGYFGFDEMWVSASFAIMLLAFVLVWFVMLPAQNALIDAVQQPADTSKASSRIAMATGLYDLGFLVLLVLMVWKPGH